MVEPHRFIWVHIIDAIVQCVAHASSGRQADTLCQIDLIFGMQVTRYMWIIMHKKIPIKSILKWSGHSDAFDCHLDALDAAHCS